MNTSRRSVTRKKSAQKVRLALKSAEGAQRHVVNLEGRARRANV